MNKKLSPSVDKIFFEEMRILDGNYAELRKKTKHAIQELLDLYSGMKMSKENAALVTKYIGERLRRVGLEIRCPGCQRPTYVYDRMWKEGFHLYHISPCKNDSYHDAFPTDLIVIDPYIPPDSTMHPKNPDETVQIFQI